MLRRLVRFLFHPSAFKREAPAQTPGDVKPQTREEYLRELENDPLFEEITGDFTLIVGAAHPPSTPKSEPPESSET